MDQRIHAFAYQTGVRSEYQNDGLCGVRFGDKTVDVRCFDGGHEQRSCPGRTAARSDALQTRDRFNLWDKSYYDPATKCAASRERIFSAITLAALFSASRRPRSPA